MRREERGGQGSQVMFGYYLILSPCRDMCESKGDLRERGESSDRVASPRQLLTSAILDRAVMHKTNTFVFHFPTLWINHFIYYLYLQSGNEIINDK